VVGERGGAQKRSEGVRRSCCVRYAYLHFGLLYEHAAESAPAVVKRGRGACASSRIHVGRFGAPVSDDDESGEGRERATARAMASDSRRMHLCREHEYPWPNVHFKALCTSAPGGNGPLDDDNELVGWSQARQPAERASGGGQGGEALLDSTSPQQKSLWCG
jgi:hypothetical protein